MNADRFSTGNPDDGSGFEEAVEATMIDKLRRISNGFLECIGEDRSIRPVMDEWLGEVESYLRSHPHVAKMFSTLDRAVTYEALERLIRRIDGESPNDREDLGLADALAEVKCLQICLVLGAEPNLKGMPFVELLRGLYEEWTDEDDDRYPS